MTSANTDTQTAWHYTGLKRLPTIIEEGRIRAHAHVYTSALGVPMPNQMRVWFSVNQQREPTKYIFNLIAAEADKRKKAELVLAALERAGGAFFRVGHPAALLLPVGGFVAPFLADARLRSIQNDWRVSLSDVRLADCIGIEELNIDGIMNDEYVWKRIWTPEPAWPTVEAWPASLYTPFSSASKGISLNS